MSNKDNGGPAFPCSENGTSHTIAMAAMLDLPDTATADEKDKVYISTKAIAIQGMSLRDYFAAKAMQGICSHADTWGLISNEKIAAASYELADAMLAARSA